MSKSLKTIGYIVLSVLIIVGIVSLIGTLIPFLLVFFVAIFIYSKIKRWYIEKKYGDIKRNYTNTYNAANEYTESEEDEEDFVDSSDVIDVPYEEVDEFKK